MKTEALQNVIISRTDSIGDVMLTLPLAQILKTHFPKIKIAFLGKNYTRPIVECCEFVDEFIELNDFLNQPVTIAGKAPECILHVFPVKEIAARAKALKIPIRIGTTNRLYHWTSCNRLVKLSRKNSDLHEAQLNCKLLAPFKIPTHYTLAELGNAVGFTQVQPLENQYWQLLQPTKKNIILHPKSQGSAREWGLENFATLIHLLEKAQIHLFISGTEKEKQSLAPLLDVVKHQVTDITGLMPLSQFISFIQHCDGLVANSTGPLHIAAALGKHVFGMYPPMRPMHPGRWMPIGKHVHIFVKEKGCDACKKKNNNCVCMQAITPQEVAASIHHYLK